MAPCTVIPQLVYDDVTEAIAWLCDRFGFTERWRVPLDVEVISPAAIAARRVPVV